MAQHNLTEQEESLIHRMAQESTEMWLASIDRNQPNSEVVICRRPERAVYLTRVGNVEGNIYGWQAETRPLRMDDAQEFFAAFGSHWAYWLDVVLVSSFKVRAYIKNGRKEGWTVSVASCA